jgi:hypothetical protein
MRHAGRELMDEMTPEHMRLSGLTVSPIERDEDDGYQFVGTADAPDPKPSKVRVLDYRSVLMFLPFNWEDRAELLVGALEREQLGAFDGVVVVPRIEVDDAVPKRYVCTDVIFCKDSWHHAVALDLAVLDVEPAVKEITKTARYRLARWENRRRVA